MPRRRKDKKDRKLRPLLPTDMKSSGPECGLLAVSQWGAFENDQGRKVSEAAGDRSGPRRGKTMEMKDRLPHYSFDDPGLVGRTGDPWAHERQAHVDSTVYGESLWAYLLLKIDTDGLRFVRLLKIEHLNQLEACG